MPRRYNSRHAYRSRYYDHNLGNQVNVSNNRNNGEQGSAQIEAFSRAETGPIPLQTEIDRHVQTNETREENAHTHGGGERNGGNRTNGRKQQGMSFQDLFGNHNRRGRGRGRGRGRARGTGRSTWGANQGTYHPRAAWRGGRTTYQPTHHRTNSQIPNYQVKTEKEENTFDHHGLGKISQSTTHPPNHNQTSVSLVRQPAPQLINERDDNRTSLRKRKFVRGGRIAKLPTIFEYQADLYCQVCEDYFPDPNAKSCHDRSRAHRLRIEEKRITIDREIQFKKVKTETPLQKKVMSYSYQQLMVAMGKKKPASFMSWADRSVQEAKKYVGDNQQNFMLSVLREIIHEFELHDDQCTLYRETWSRKPLATGKHYFKVTPIPVETKVFTEAEAMKMAPILHSDEKSNKDNKEDQRDQGVQAMDLDLTIPKEEEQKSKWVKGGTETVTDSKAEKEQSHITNRKEKVDKQDDVDDVIMNNDQDGHYRNDGPYMRQNPPHMSSAAVRIWQANYIEAPDFRRKAWTRFAHLKTNERNRGPKPKELEQSLVNNYNRLVREYEKRNYVYKDWSKEMKEIAVELEKNISRNNATRMEMLRNCYELLTEGAIKIEQWGKAFDACGRLVETFKGGETFEKKGWIHLGKWLLLSLFKNAKQGAKRAGSAKVFSPYMELNSRLRDLPANATGDGELHRCVRAWSAVICNNYYEFFKQAGIGYLKSHQYIMDELSDVVRERAILTMTTMGCVGGDDKEGQPVYRVGTPSLGELIELLGWEKECGDECAMNEKVNMVRKFIEDLSFKTKFGGGGDQPEFTSLLTVNEWASMGKNDVVDLQKILWWDRKVIKGDWNARKV